MLSSADTQTEAESGQEGRISAPERAAPAIRIELRPRCALNPQTARQFFIVTCVITFSVAGIAALYGAWPALIFAALEMWILHIAMRCSLARGRDYERVEISDAEVHIEVCKAEQSTEINFLRHWTRVRMQAPDCALHPRRLLIECQGKRRELGAFLTETERSEAAARLKRLIGAVGESPDLPDR